MRLHHVQCRMPSRFGQFGELNFANISIPPSTPSLLASGHQSPHKQHWFVHCALFSSLHFTIFRHSGSDESLKQWTCTEKKEKKKKTASQNIPGRLWTMTSTLDYKFTFVPDEESLAKNCYHHLIFARSLSLPLIHFKSLNYSTMTTIVAPGCLPFRWSTTWKTKRVEIAARGVRARFVSMHRIKNINTQWASARNM